MTTDHRDHDLRERALRLGLHGLLANWDDVKDAAWLAAVLGYEESERTRRSLERRIKDARLPRDTVHKIALDGGTRDFS